MSDPPEQKVRDALTHDLREAYMEIFPSPDIEEQLGVLEPNSYVAVTCSPTKGVAETLNLTERLINRGFRVAPHVAAKNVRDQAHLREIMNRLKALDVESMFVPGGDRPEPVGDFTTAFELLRSIRELDHNIREIGIAAHPEGHPDVDDETMLIELEKKQALANYIVTQMCFDAERVGEWLQDIVHRGIELPVWIGLPGAVERSRLIRTSLRIGVGDSLRFLKRKSSVAAELMKSKVYHPEQLLFDIAKYRALPEVNVAGYHLFCFNQVEGTENWRNETLRSLL
jgi:methylenetetrahydrofolate reductase (NADPH)